ncbi:MAG: hypothetical protein U9R26_06715 [Campylobacterota bacterium]|nr:hypothetical protein [Campylobacterota bacterium]
MQIQIYKIKNKGSNNYSLKILSKLDPITMGAPKNSFQKGILDAYNQCRTEALHKYFPILDKNEIMLLLQDNYLQKKDVKILLPYNIEKESRFSNQKKGWESSGVSLFIGTKDDIITLMTDNYFQKTDIKATLEQ